MARPRRMAQQRGEAPTALQSVLNSIATTAARLCEARDARIALLEGDAIQLVAFVGAPLKAPFRHPLDRSTPHGDAIVSRRVIHVRDMQVAAKRRYPRFVELARVSGMRTVLVAPLLREGAALGTILIRRDRVQPFTAKQIALLKTFADQAAIAIENARLSEELGARNRALNEALDQQTATSEVLSVISQSQTDVQPVFDTIVESAARLCEGSFSALFSFDGRLMNLVATHNWAPAALEVARGMWPAPPNPELMSGRAVIECRVVHVADVTREHQTDRPRELLRDIGSRGVLAVPMLRDGLPLGAIAVARVEPGLFADNEVALLKTFADQAVIAIENVHLFTELQTRNRDLTEALEQQTATAEVLSVISRSPTELQPVLDAVAENAARVCGANDALMRLVDGDSLRLAAHHGPLPDLDRTIPLNRESATGRAILDGQPVHIHDLAAMPESEMGIGRSLQRRFGHRTVLAIPLLRQGAVIGAFLIRRLEVQPFSDKQIALLKTFADQAVIAIENVRLFTELEARNRALTEALDQQTATSEILRAISSSPTELQPILDAIAERAARLCEAWNGTIVLRDGDGLRMKAHYGPIAEQVGIPLPLDQTVVSGRAFLEARPIHVHDLSNDDRFPVGRDMARRFNTHTILAVPLLREGAAIGVVLIRRTEVRPFTDEQIRLLQTFADQAVIAIENVRLFTELQSRNRDLSEALEQQTATAAILRAISSSPTDTQPVFDGIVQSALRLLNGHSANVLLVRGDELHIAALSSVDAASDAAVRANFPAPLSRAGVATHVVQTAQPHIVADVETDPFVTDNIRLTAPLRGYRSMLHVPMLRDGSVIGIISVTRREPGAFSDDELELLRTFADQAVIAIENVRLFRELEARNTALTEALDQQMATSEILGVIARSPTDVQPVLDAVAESAARLCGATDALIMRVDGGMLHRVAHVGDMVAVSMARPLTGETPTGRAVVERRIVHIADILAEIARGDYAGTEALQRTVGFRTILSIPLMREESVVGVITIRRPEVRPFTDAQIALVKTFADQAVIAIENVRLFKELQERNTALTEALEQRTATAEILRAIAASPTDLQPVLDTIARNAARICAAADASVALVDGEIIRIAARFGPLTTPLGLEVPLDRGAVSARAVIDVQTVHVVDAMEVSETEFPITRKLAREFGHRSSVATPLVRKGEALGMLFVRRTEVRPFTEREIELLQTFSDQAVIAIENVRLFKELEEKNRALTAAHERVSEALDQQTATSEILRVISQSPTDYQPVFDAIVRNATTVCGAFDALLVLVEEDGFVPHAHYGAIPPGPGKVGLHGTATGRAIREARTVHVEDLLATDEYPIGTELARRNGYRTVLTVPLLRDGIAIGAIGIRRTEVRPFTDKQIGLLQTFADQAVIAIENVRLFTELEEKNRALTAAHAEVTETLEQQTAMAEILRVISTSPTDLQPVLDAVVRSAARFCGAYDSSIFQIDGENLRADAHHGPVSQPPGFLVPLRRSTVAGRSVLERRVVSVTDLQTATDDFPEGSALARQTGQRATLSAPLLRKGEPTGVILLRRSEAIAFTEKHVALLKTFADQAVIAIENVRLFKELEARNAALTESLEQQTATADILRVISGSPTDLSPVFDTILSTASRLCGANFAALWRIDGGRMVFAAHYNASPEFAESLRRQPLVPSRGGPARLAVLERRVVHVADMTAERGFSPVALQIERARTVLAVPLMRDETLVGVMAMWRREVRLFSDQQVALVKTFADQAVIAIENVRLFRELEARNAALTESLDQQTATSEILRVISASPTDVQPVLDAVAEAAARLCGAHDAVIRRVDGDFLPLWAHHGDIPLPASVHNIPLSRGRAIGHAVLEKRTIHIHDIAELQARGDYLEARSTAQEVGYRTMLVTPLIREGAAIGVILIRRMEVRPFSDKQVELLQTFADQAVIAIENVRLFNELQASNRELTTALDQQTATSDILRVISRSPTDVQPVFKAIVDSATRLVGAYSGALTQVVDDHLALAAFTTTEPAGEGTLTANFPMALNSSSSHAIAVRDRVPFNTADAQTDPRIFETGRAIALARGYRSQVVVPLLHRDTAIGTISLTRREPGGFRDDEIALVQTFADQAVIAIENVRLFSELQQRTHELTRSVEQLTALGDVGQAVSSTLDLETVLTTIASRAAQLSGTRTCTVYEYDEAAEEFHLRATHNVDERVLALTRVRPIRKGEGVAGRVAETHAPVQIENITADEAYRGALREVLVSAGVRSVLAVPLLRERRLIGSLIVTRNSPGRFAEEVVTLLQTFATQSAIAIQNARLFRELEAKGVELAEASRHKSQFLANMSHELRTPMNAILGYTELIADGIYGAVPEKMADVLTRVEGSGRHLLGLINDVLDLSKIEAGQLTLTLADYAMKEVVEAVSAAAEPLAAAKNLRFVVDVAPGLPTGRGDQRRLAQVLLNLVGNAIKFTDQGQVALRVGAAAGLFTIAVSDTGPGIAPADQERIFEEFQQADTSHTRPKGGTGLGLAIARRIVAMHGGRLWVESALGEGATFRLTLPVRTEKQVREVTA